MPIQRREIYRGKIVELYLEEVELPNGTRAEFETVDHPGGAAVVALDGKQCVCLLRQYRHIARDWLWELPAGKLDVGEPPLNAAQRELEEEAGLRARQWGTLGRILSSPGVFRETVHLFLARDLMQAKANTEAHELIEVNWLPLDRAIAMAHAGEILDAKTLVGLFRAEKVLRSGAD